MGFHLRPEDLLRGHNVHGLFDDFPMPSFPSVPSWAGLPSFEDLQRHLLGEAQDPGAAEFSPGDEGILRYLKRAELNGQKALVLRVDAKRSRGIFVRVGDSGRKVQIHSEKLHRTGSALVAGWYYTGKGRRVQVLGFQPEKGMYDVLLENGQPAVCKRENLRSSPASNLATSARSGAAARSRSRSPRTRTASRSSPAATARGTAAERPARQGVCVVCLTQPAEMAGRECFHLCICRSCHQNLPSRQCPMCRKEQLFRQVYVANVD